VDTTPGVSPRICLARASSSQWSNPLQLIGMLSSLQMHARPVSVTVNLRLPFRGRGLLVTFILKRRLPPLGPMDGLFCSASCGPGSTDVATRVRPLDPAELFAFGWATTVLCSKREDLQPRSFRFKLRGAYNRMVHLSASELERV